MVQRSLINQERFIEQEGRNHAEMMYSSDRNHGHMIGMFNSTLLTIAGIARQLVNQK